jgi:2-C-methyl-D-erythritol 4-phosphate cytidylyltransferase/2-C-methyl-D-erythritol 2,4-cyclodiphosphate synthase
MAPAGPSRRDSVRSGLAAYANLGPEDILLIHDAARPLLSRRDLDALLIALEGHRAATLAAPLVDTVLRSDGEAIPRENLWAIQTPQGFRYGDILAAHQNAAPDHPATDDAGVMFAAHRPVHFVPAQDPNLKITRAEDFMLAQRLLNPTQDSDYRTGQGFDVHAFDPDAQDVRHIRLCGLDIPYHQKLLGHSDADVALHALTDAVLGAIGAGDIGLHFPPSDPAHKNRDSADFLIAAMDMVRVRGGRLVNADVTIITEAPKVTPHRAAMTARIAEIVQVPVSRINVKATTTEGLGFTGRGEGIAAQASVTITLPAEPLA